MAQHSTNMTDKLAKETNKPIDNYCTLTENCIRCKLSTEQRDTSDSNPKVKVGLSAFTPYISTSRSKTQDKPSIKFKTKYKPNVVRMWKPKPMEKVSKGVSKKKIWSVSDVYREQSSKSKIRCKFWPRCTNKNCKFTHPKLPCRAGDCCRFNNKCSFIHPKDLL